MTQPFERVFLIDLDGTLTAKEILPEIAKEAGLELELGELTRQAVAGLVPYHQSLTRRVELLGQIRNSRIRDVVAQIPVHPELLDFMRANRQRCFIVTANLDVWVQDFCRRLGFRAFTSTATERGDRVERLDSILDKRSVSRAFANAVAVGDGHNDAGMLEAAEIGIACGIVHEPASSLLSVATHAVYNEAALCRFLQQLS